MDHPAIPVRDEERYADPAIEAIEHDRSPDYPVVGGSGRFEQQGHGHTADVDRPITYEQMAD
jgi:hypothetical protein